MRSDIIRTMNNKIKYLMFYSDLKKLTQIEKLTIK